MVPVKLKLLIHRKDIISDHGIWRVFFLPRQNMTMPGVHAYLVNF